MPSRSCEVTYLVLKAVRGLCAAACEVTLAARLRCRDANSVRGVTQGAGEHYATASAMLCVEAPQLPRNTCLLLDSHGEPGCQNDMVS